MSLSFTLTTAATCLALMLVGGGLYEFLVVDPFWPKRLDSHSARPRRDFAQAILNTYSHSLRAFRYFRPRCAVVRSGDSRVVVGIVRIWSAFDFIPKALAFEKAEPGSITERSARRKWRHRSLFRLPLELIACGAMFAALAGLARVW
jgi:hypothetical protein